MTYVFTVYFLNNWSTCFCCKMPSLDILLYFYLFFFHFSIVRKCSTNLYSSIDHVTFLLFSFFFKFLSKIPTRVASFLCKYLQGWYLRKLIFYFHHSINMVQQAWTWQMYQKTCLKIVFRQSLNMISCLLDICL